MFFFPHFCGISEESGEFSNILKWVGKAEKGGRCNIFYNNVVHVVWHFSGAHFNLILYNYVTSLSLLHLIWFLGWEHYLDTWQTPHYKKWSVKMIQFKHLSVFYGPSWRNFLPHLIWRMLVYLQLHAERFLLLFTPQVLVILDEFVFVCICVCVCVMLNLLNYHVARYFLALLPQILDNLSTNFLKYQNHDCYLRTGKSFSLFFFCFKKGSHYLGFCELRGNYWWFYVFPKLFNFKEARQIISGKQRHWKNEAFNLDVKVILLIPTWGLNGLTNQGQRSQVIICS